MTLRKAIPPLCLLASLAMGGLLPFFDVLHLPALVVLVPGLAIAGLLLLFLALWFKRSALRWALVCLAPLPAAALSFGIGRLYFHGKAEALAARVYAYQESHGSFPPAAALPAPEVPLMEVTYAPDARRKQFSLTYYAGFVFCQTYDSRTRKWERPRHDD